MKIRIAIILFLCCAVTTVIYAHGKADADTARNNNYTGTIYLYGEQHGVKKITDKELALWRAYYTKGLRHLFLELPSYTAEYLNMWLREKDNTILEEVFNDWKGTAFHNQHTYNFFMQIKELCPQTVFHGTDVGHQYGTTGERFLRYLESKQQQNIPAYLRAQEIIQLKVEANQVYVIDYTKIDNSKMRLYYISEGKMRNGQLITENIAAE